MRTHGWLVAVVMTAVIATLGVVAFMPSAEQVIDVRAADYFTPAQIERGQAFRRPNLWIALAGLAAQIALLVALVRRPPALLRRARRWWQRGLAGAALAGGLSLVTLPVSVVLRIRSIDVGLTTRSWPGWAWDWLLSSALNALIMGIVAAVLLALIGRLPRTWWLPGTAFIVLGATLWVIASPLVLNPLFNRFTPLRDEALRAEILALAREAGVREVSQVLVMDASRRTTGANAYVAGLGASKRIVVYDTLLAGEFTRGEQRSIIAHELGHERYHDLRGGLLYVALVAPFALFAVALTTARLARGHPPGAAITLPALALAILTIATGVQYISNTLSRGVEARADAFALRATGDPDALIALQRRLVERNVSDPEPPAWVVTVFGTHPPALRRIGMALAYEERVQAAAARASTSWGLSRYP